MLAGTGREWRVVPILAVLAAIPVTGFGQTPDPLTVTGKLHYHAKSTYGPGSMLGLAAYAAILQADCGTWREWRVVPILAVLAAIPVTGFGQTPDPLTVTGKLHYHAKSTYGPGSMLGLARTCF